MGKYLLQVFSLLGLACMVTTTTAQHTAPEGMVYIGGGRYTPQYGTDKSVETAPFYLDRYPVTNADWYAFLQQYPEWKKENAKAVFVDQAYLKHWPGKTNALKDLEKISRQPVVNVSWFAAKKYCECQGKRLPSVDEWEFAALASESKPVGADDPEFYQKVLDWYAKPSGGSAGDVGSTFRNYYGVYDMYGLIWEWVLDFNTAMVGARFGKDANLDDNLFCGSGAAQASDPANYVAFMRYAFRSSLKANYSIGNLGFRCAKGIENETH